MTYLDNAATSFPKPVGVYETMDRAARAGLGNPGRSGHRLAIAAERVVADCRVKLNALLGGAGPDRFALTFNGTDSLNLAIRGALKPGDHVVVGALEHNSVRRPIAAIAKEFGEAAVTWVRADDRLRYRAKDFAQALRPNTRLVVLSHASNVTGVIHPIDEIANVCRQNGALTLVDGAQTAGSLPVQLTELGVDLFAASGHKGLLGPTGTGFLYVRPGVAINPLRRGGTGGQSELLEQPDEMPARLEAGTPNVHGISGWCAGLDYLLATGIDKVSAHEQLLANRLRDELRELSAVRMLPDPATDLRQTGVVSFGIADLEPVDVAAILDDSFSICVRPGLHCNPGTHEASGTYPAGTIRASFGPFNTESDAAKLVAAIAEIISA